MLFTPPPVGSERAVLSETVCYHPLPDPPFCLIYFIPIHPLLGWYFQVPNLIPCREHPAHFRLQPSSPASTFLLPESGRNLWPLKSPSHCPHLQRDYRSIFLYYDFNSVLGGRGDKHTQSVRCLKLKSLAHIFLSKLNLLLCLWLA